MFLNNCLKDFSTQIMSSETSIFSQFYYHNIKNINLNVFIIKNQLFEILSLN